MASSQGNGDPNIFAPLELEHRDLTQMITCVLTRSVRMVFNRAMQLPVPRVLNLLHVLASLPSDFQWDLTFRSYNPSRVRSNPLFVLDRVKAHDLSAAWSQSEERRRLPLECP